MFEIITIDELLKRLDSYSYKELHIHHTWKPEKKDFNGSNAIQLQQGMKNYHLGLGWSDIGQHVTLLPNGLFVTGRDFGQTPASIIGYNEGGFACEMLGNFDIGHDVLEGAQKQSILRLARYFFDKSRYIRFHRENANKTCPGSGIDKAGFMSEVKNLGVCVNKEGWLLNNGVWHYYRDNIMYVNAWAQDSKGWCYLNNNGDWLQEGWAKDSQGWCYIRNGYWVNHSTWAKDSEGWQYIGDNGYWDSSVPAKAENPLELK